MKLSALIDITVKASVGAATTRLNGDGVFHPRMPNVTVVAGIADKSAIGDGERIKILDLGPGLGPVHEHFGIRHNFLTLERTSVFSCDSLNDFKYCGARSELFIMEIVCARRTMETMHCVASQLCCVYFNRNFVNRSVVNQC